MDLEMICPKEWEVVANGKHLDKKDFDTQGPLSDLVVDKNDGLAHHKFG